MPIGALSLCTIQGCPNMVRSGRCPEHLAEARKESDQKRPNSAARGYGTGWQKVRRNYLAAHPTCESPTCSALPFWKRPESTDVDHIDGQGPYGPHGNATTNLQALCHPCHSQKTAQQDGGFGRKTKPPTTNRGRGKEIPAPF